MQFTLTILFVFSIFSAVAQNTINGQVFSHFSTDLSNEKTLTKSFKFSRVFIGTKHVFNDHFFSTIILNATPVINGNNLSTVVREANINWNINDKFAFKFGQFKSTHYKFLDKSWGFRYIDPSIMGKNDWIPIVDLGAEICYSINSNLSLDLHVLNGEGVRFTNNIDGKNTGGIGITFVASENLSLRIQQEVSPRTTYSNKDVNEETSSASISYGDSKFNLGFEFNLQNGSQNTVDQSIKSTSLYASYQIERQISILARYDEITSENDWNITHDGTYIIVGVEKELTEGIKTALTYRSSTKDNESYSNEILFLNVSYQF